jgi:hypothetical protein
LVSFDLGSAEDVPGTSIFSDVLNRVYNGLFYRILCDPRIIQFTFLNEATEGVPSIVDERSSWDTFIFTSTGAA